MPDRIKLWGAAYSGIAVQTAMKLWLKGLSVPDRTSAGLVVASIHKVSLQYNPGGLYEVSMSDDTGNVVITARMWAVTFEEGNESYSEISESGLAISFERSQAFYTKICEGVNYDWMVFTPTIISYQGVELTELKSVDRLTFSINYPTMTKGYEVLKTILSKKSGGGVKIDPAILLRFLIDHMKKPVEGADIRYFRDKHPYLNSEDDCLGKLFRQALQRLSIRWTDEGLVMKIELGDDQSLSILTKRNWFDVELNCINNPIEFSPDEIALLKDENSPSKGILHLDISYTV